MGTLHLRSRCNTASCNHALVTLRRYRCIYATWTQNLILMSQLQQLSLVPISIPRRQVYLNLYSCEWCVLTSAVSWSQLEVVPRHEVIRLGGTVATAERVLDCTDVHCLPTACSLRLRVVPRETHGVDTIRARHGDMTCPGMCLFERTRVAPQYRRHRISVACRLFDPRLNVGCYTMSN